MASPVEAVLLLADYAQVDPSGKVHIMGAGWSVTGSPTAAQAVVGLIKIPWDRTNTPMDMRLHLVDADGQEVVLPGPPGSPDTTLEMRSTLEVGRPPGIPAGTPIESSFAINVGPLPLVPGRYTWQLEIGADDVFTTSFQVQVA